MLSPPPSAVTVLRERSKRLLKLRLALGLRKHDNDALLLGEPDGKARQARRASFHALPTSTCLRSSPPASTWWRFASASGTRTQQ